MRHASKVAIILSVITPFFVFAQVAPLWQPVDSTTQGPMSCFDFSRTLMRGSKSFDVRALQYVLMREGLSIPASEYGQYGDATVSAVNAFQQKYASDILKGIAPTGAVGRATRAKLNARYGCGVSRAATSALPASGKISLVVKNIAIDQSGITGTFCNIGTNDVPAFPVRIRLNGVTRDVSILGAKNAGACDTETLAYGTWGLNYDAGVTYSVVTAIDPLGMYKTAQISFPLSATTTLALPALSGVHLSIRGIQLKSTGLQTTFCNLGDTDLTSFPVRIVVNGISRDFDVAAVYSHGACKTITYTFDTWGVPSISGTSIVASVNVDPNNVYKENNEFDNSGVISGAL